MHLIIQLVIVGLVLTSLFLLLSIRNRMTNKEIREGDMVICSDLQDPSYVNLITIVLADFGETACIRGHGTTCTLSKKHLRKIPVTPLQPILVPGEPVYEPYYPGNKAVFRVIPLSWFIYTNPEKELKQKSA